MGVSILNRALQTTGNAENRRNGLHRGRALQLGIQYQVVSSEIINIQVTLYALSRLHIGRTKERGHDLRESKEKVYGRGWREGKGEMQLYNFKKFKECKEKHLERQESPGNVPVKQAPDPESEFPSTHKKLGIGRGLGSGLEGWFVGRQVDPWSLLAREAT